MTALPDTFAAFILTHGRPDKVYTARTLERCGYTGRLYFVVDDEDDTVEQYRSNFGAERVIVFSKAEEAERADEGNNFGERRAIMYARNACFTLAEQIGVTHFIELDDDYMSFCYRLENKGAKPVQDMNRLLLAFLEFYDSIPALATIAFAQGGDFNWGFPERPVAKRKAMNSFICSTLRPFRFVGCINEDVNTYTVVGSRGALFFTISSVQLTQRATQSQDRGMTDWYKRFGTYVKSFSTAMMMPSAVKVGMLHSKTAPRLHHFVKWPNCVPCIIRDEGRWPNEES